MHTTEPDARAILLGEYIAEHGATVRSAAAAFGISKSTVHKDVTGRLRQLNPQLYSEVRNVLGYNKAQRHIRGGDATRRKYLTRRELSENLSGRNANPSGK